MPVILLITLVIFWIFGLWGETGIIPGVFVFGLVAAVSKRQWPLLCGQFGAIIFQGTTRQFALVLLVFGAAVVLVSPQVDAHVSALYYQNGVWIGAEFATFVSHNISRAIFYIGVLGAILLVPMAFFVPAPWFRWLANCFGYFFLTQILLMLGVVHEIIKPLFARSRPRHVPELVEQGQIDPWWQLGELCTRNCSMPSGESSAAFACFAVALAWNRGAFWPSLRFTLLFGFLMGAFRIIGGAHFASDVIMSAVFMLPLSYGLWWLTERAKRLVRRSA